MSETEDQSRFSRFLKILTWFVAGLAVGFVWRMFRQEREPGPEQPA